jgi:transcriptional regulator with XRE-family HTH domain
LVLKTTKPKDFSYPSEIKSLGDHLRAKRVDLNLTQKRVAERIVADETTIYHWENNRTTPVIRFIPRIIEFLGYTPYAPTESLPEILRLCRQSLGLSQRKLASVLGVDESSLRSWESGRRKPSATSRRLIGTFLSDEAD